MKSNHILFAGIGLFISAITFSGCKKNTGPDPSDSGQLKLSFDNRAGSSPLSLNGPSYTNAAGENFIVSMFNYYVSNIALRNADGDTYTVPADDSYFLVKEEDESTQTLTLSVPEGDYTEVSFLIGVDSLKSTRPVNERTGVLDPTGEALGMYWTWNSGYIFVKMEGTSPQAPLDSSSGTNRIRYHIGGFGGYNSPAPNNLRRVTLSFDGARAQVRKDKTKAPNVHIEADILKLFQGNNQVSFAATPTVMGGPAAPLVADNYSHMFRVDHVHND